MKRTTFLFAAAFLCLAVPPATQAAVPWRPRPIIGPVGPVPRHMPGWDWWRTYPWSPYNYGRNPYNPLVFPYPYPVPYPDPVVVPVTPPTPDPAVTPAPDTAVEVSGPLSSPPPGSAVIRVRVPDTWARVSFNGKDTDTSGRQRTFVAPGLNAGQSRRYQVTVSWSKGGQSFERRQAVRVSPGQIVALDFTRTAGSR